MSDPSTAYSSAPAAYPPADWYPDPTGEGQLRWWGGLAWTEHVKPFPAPAPAPATPALATQASATPPLTTTASYVPMDSTYVPFAHVVAAPTRIAPTRSANTLPIWLLAVSPMLSVVAQAIVLAAPTTALIPILWALNLGLALGFIGLVIWDRIAIRGLGLTPSSPWWFIWWALLPSALVYLIVRRVSLKRQGVISNAPSNVFVLMLVASGLVAYFALLPLINARSASIAVDALETQLASALAHETATTWNVECPPAAPILTANSSFTCSADDSDGRAINLLITVDQRLNVTFAPVDTAANTLSS